MNHRIQLKKLSKTPAHRKAMIRNMLVALFRYERIKTTLAKSKVLQRIAERMITRARVDSVANRRLVAKWVQDKEVHAKLFTSIAPLFVDRKGGYTRIVKLGQRYGDASEMVYISLVVSTNESENDSAVLKKDSKRKKGKSGSKNTVSNQSPAVQASQETVDSSHADNETVSVQNKEEAQPVSANDTVQGDNTSKDGDVSSKGE